jgi:acyl carrier protein
MTDSIREFVFESLREMNIDTEDIDDDTQLGPRGADLASLTLAELALRVEDRYGLKFAEEETDMLAGMTVGEFCAMVADRTGAANATVQAE